MGINTANFHIFINHVQNIDTNFIGIRTIISGSWFRRYIFLVGFLTFISIASYRFGKCYKKNFVYSERYFVHLNISSTNNSYLIIKLVWDSIVARDWHKSSQINFFICWVGDRTIFIVLWWKFFDYQINPKKMWVKIWVFSSRLSKTERKKELRIR